MNLGVSNFINERSLDCVEPIYLHSDAIARPQKLRGFHKGAYAPGCSGEQQVAGFQSHGLRQVRNLVPYVENKMPCV